MNINKKLRNFLKISVILTILFTFIIQGFATTKSTVSEEIFGFSDAEFEWIPVNGDGSHAIIDNEIVLHEVPQLVTLEIYCSGWSPNLMKALQATIDSSGYSNGVGGTLVPFGWPGSPEDGCFIDNARTDYVFNGMANIDAVYTGDLDYIWGATLLVGAKVDDSQTYYLGTLILEVPSNSEGTYTIDFNPGTPIHTKTYMTDDIGQFIFPLTLTPAYITINEPPNKPSIPDGPGTGVTDVEYTYYGVTTDPDNDWLSYKFDFGNRVTDWTSYTESGIGNTENNIWSEEGTYQVKVQAKDIHGEESIWSNPLTVVISKENNPPNKPNPPSGPNSGKTDTTYQYSAYAIDPDDDRILLLFDWDDGTDSGWEGPVNSSESITVTHEWSEEGDYSIKVKAMDTNFAESEWSDPLVVSMPKNKSVNQIPRIIIWLFERFPFLEHHFN